MDRKGLAAEELMIQTFRKVKAMLGGQVVSLPTSPLVKISNYNDNAKNEYLRFDEVAILKVNGDTLVLSFGEIINNYQFYWPSPYGHKIIYLITLGKEKIMASRKDFKDKVSKRLENSIFLQNHLISSRNDGFINGNQHSRLLASNLNVFCQVISKSMINAPEYDRDKILEQSLTYPVSRYVSYATGTSNKLAGILVNSIKNRCF